MEEPACAYLGHFARNPSDIALVSADSFLDALDECDMVGQPDEGSFQSLRDPLVIRFRASLEMTEDLDGEPVERVGFAPHPEGAVVLAGHDLVRLLDRIKDHESSITGDVLRTIGRVCPKCGFPHDSSLECKLFLEPVNRLALYLGYTDDDPHQVFVVAGPADDEDAVLELAQAAGASPEILMPVRPGVVFSLQMKDDGTIHSIPNYTCYTEWPEWLLPLENLLREAKAGR